MPLHQWFSVIASTVLHVLVLSALIHGLWGGLWRRLPLLFLFVLASLMTNVINTALVIDHGRWTAETAIYYWAGSLLLDLLELLLLLSLICQALPRGSHLAAWLTVGAMAYIALSVWLVRVPSLNLWMTQLTRNLSFGEMALTFFLWTLLIRQPNRLLLLLAAGLGLSLAGSAAGHSLRQLSKASVVAGNLILVSSHLLQFTIWWSALRAASRTRVTVPDTAGYPETAPRREERMIT